MNSITAEDKFWALCQCSSPNGFTPNALSTVELLQHLESRGLVRGSDNAPLWMITDAGRAELYRLEGCEDKP